MYTKEQTTDDVSFLKLHGELMILLGKRGLVNWKEFHVTWSRALRIELGDGPLP